MAANIIVFISRMEATAACVTMVTVWRQMEDTVKVGTKMFICEQKYLLSFMFGLLSLHFLKVLKISKNRVLCWIKQINPHLGPQYKINKISAS